MAEGNGKVGLAETVKAARVKLGLTQTAFAAEKGLPVGVIMRIEAKRARVLPMMHVSMIEMALGISHAEMLRFMDTRAESYGGRYVPVKRP